MAPEQAAAYMAFINKLRAEMRGATCLAVSRDACCMQTAGHASWDVDCVSWI